MKQLALLLALTLTVQAQPRPLSHQLHRHARELAGHINNGEHFSHQEYATLADELVRWSNQTDFTKAEAELLRHPEIRQELVRFIHDNGLRAYVAAIAVQIRRMPTESDLHASAYYLNPISIRSCADIQSSGADLMAIGGALAFVPGFQETAGIFGIVGAMMWLAGGHLC